MKPNFAIIVAAGNSTRFNNNISKQYYNINNKPIIFYSLSTFLNNNNIDYVVPVINTNHISIFENIISKFSFNSNKKLLPYVIGGNTRQDSVINALNSIKKLNPNKVLIHDCARPFVSNDIINNVFNNIKEDTGVIPVLKINDSLKEIKDSYIINTANRDTIVKAQTPQGFYYKSLLNAYNSLNNIVTTDDSEIFRKAGFKILTIEGNLLNQKITTISDLQMLENIITPKHYKTGQGFDVHKFTENKKLILGGIEIPFSKGLEGHSDADVVIHSVVDAILGAIGEGDIGYHFPPSEEKWKNANSKIFLEHCVNLLNNINAKIINIDITIICEKPKITPYSLQIKQNLANILKIPCNSLNVKATTTEKMGFTGREEGIATLALVTILH